MGVKPRRENHMKKPTQNMASEPRTAPPAASGGEVGPQVATAEQQRDAAILALRQVSVALDSLRLQILALVGT